MKSLIRCLYNIIAKLESEKFTISKIEVELSVYNLIKSHLKDLKYPIEGASNMWPPVYFKVYNKWDIFKNKPKEFGLPETLIRQYNINDIA